MEDKQFSFLLEAYKTSVDYYIGYAEGIWQRFNIILGMELVLAGLFASAWLNTQLISAKGVLLIPLIGLLVALILYVQSAQERYVLKHSRERLNRIREKIEEMVECRDLPALFSPLDDIDQGKRSFIFEGITSWRSKIISTSRIPAITALFLIVVWIVAIVIRP